MSRRNSVASGLPARAPRGRILVVDGARSIDQTARERLRAEGFEVVEEGTFLDAAARLVSTDVTLLVLALPDAEWVRNTILSELRRAHPALPIVAVASTVSRDLQRTLLQLQIPLVAPPGKGARELLEAVHRALDTSGASRGGRQ